jgi:pyridoxine 5'-phosphate synthase PdxJ
MIKLGVNIDHVATLRQVRLASYPDPLEASLAAARGGANIAATFRIATYFVSARRSRSI